ncbi:MAG: DnaJ domain-containing protein [Spirochaetaceae bacterium]|nr:DnaJ domain-containing protein [Spirochaetaceae bacterium]
MSIYHEILGVDEDASIEFIKKSYIKLCKTYHPDINDSNNTAKMALINEAYAILSHRSEKKSPAYAQSNQNIPGDLINYKDQAYAVYKQGLKYFNKSDLNMSNGGNNYQSNRRNLFNGDDSVNKLEQYAYKSLYYFNIICLQFPESEWYKDSIVKIKIINRRRHIIDGWKLRGEIR